jgi:hypothetical protein
VRTRDRWLLALVFVAAAVIAVRLALPTLVTHYANEKLKTMGEYSGHVADVDVALIRGAYVLRDLIIVKREANIATPFFDVARVDLSLEWKQLLLHARLVGEIAFESPVLNLVQGTADGNTQLGTGVNWPAQVREFFPFEFNRVEIANGFVTFRAPGIDTDESLTLHHLQMTVRNLDNVRREGEETFADVHMAGSIMGNAPIVVSGRLDPNSDVSTFDLDLALRQARLADVNPWLREFLKVDAEKGSFSMFVEIAASDGRFKGYVKPILEDVDIFRLDEPGDNLLRKAWEALVDLAAKVFENREKDQVATQIPLSGKLENPDADMLSTIVNLLRNAFVHAFTHSIEGTISLGDGSSETER